MERTPSYPTALHGKVSLLAGGNLAYVRADAVVNASNHWLTAGKGVHLKTVSSLTFSNLTALPPSGVNGALHSAAGHCLLEECVRLGGCEVGEAKLTSGYNLPARHVIHTVGPEEREEDRAAMLKSCYNSSLELCVQHGIRTVAFSCISTGAYRYPSVEATDIALGVVREWLASHGNSVDRVVFVTRRPKDEEAYGFLMLAYFPLL